MTKERELLRRALEYVGDSRNDDAEDLYDEIFDYLSNPSDDAEEPVKCKRCNGTGVIKTGEIDCYPDGTPYMNGPVVCVDDCPDCHPPKPAEPEAEPVAWNDITSAELRDLHLEEQFGLFCDTDEFIEISRAVIAKFKYRNLHPPKPAEPAARKPMTDEEIEKGMDVSALSHLEACAFASGVRFAEKHHFGIGRDDE